MPDWHRFKNADRYVREGAIIGDVEENASPAFFDDLSGTDFRQTLYRGDIEDLKQRFIPNGDCTGAGVLPKVDPTEVLAILGVAAAAEIPVMERLMKLVEEMMDEASSMAGHNVQGFAGAKQDDEPSLIREEEPEEEDEVVEEVLNYLLSEGAPL